jgi:hypothetical protein
VEGLDDLDDQAHDSGGGKELAAALALGSCKITQEILINLAKGVPLDVHRDGVKDAQQLAQGGVLEAVVGLWQHVLKVWVVGLDRLHRVADGASDVGPLGQVEHAAGLVVQGRDGALPASHLSSLGPFGLDRRVGCGKAVVGVAQKDQPQDRDRVLGGAQARVGAQLVGGVP